MKSGECCSLQYHELKRETIYAIRGKLRLYIGKDIDDLEEKIMMPGDTITIVQKVKIYSILSSKGLSLIK